MRILVCGSRTWDDDFIIRRVLDGFFEKYPVDFTVIEGGAAGADTGAFGWACSHALESNHQQFQADWKTHGKAAGPIRNQEMIDLGKPDVVVAFTDDFEDSKGTKDCVRRAKKAGVPVYVVSRA